MPDRAGRDAGEQTLLVEQPSHLAHGLLVRDEDLPIELRHVEDRRDITLIERAQPHDGISGQRLGRRDDDVGPALAQPLADAHQRAACTEPCDDDVDAVERRRDLCARSLVMRPRIRLVCVLERHEVPRLALGQLERQSNGTVGARVRR